MTSVETIPNNFKKVFPIGDKSCEEIKKFFPIGNQVITIYKNMFTIVGYIDTEWGVRLKLKDDNNNIYNLSRFDIEFVEV